MNMRNLLRPGSSVYPIPIGTLMTLQYNVEGNLERVYLGIGDDVDDRTKEIMSFMIQNQTVPAHLKIAGGTTIVLGVLYSGMIPEDEMNLRDIQKEMYARYKQSPDRFNFFAFNIDCTATRISGGLATQSTLAMNKFNTLQLSVVPAIPTDETVNGWLHSQYWNFVPGVCQGFYCMIADPKFSPLNIYTVIVKKIEKETDQYGNVKGIINSSNGIRLNVDYSDIVRERIVPGDVIYINYNNDISYVIHKKNTVVPDTIVCEFCGQKYKVPESGTVCCPDPHCLSKIYPEMQRFLGAHNLPMMEYNRYKALVDSKEITAFTDVLLLPEYKDLKKIGLFNPRLNAAYVLDMSKLPDSLIKDIEEKVIGYGRE